MTVTPDRLGGPSMSSSAPAPSKAGMQRKRFAPRLPAKERREQLLDTALDLVYQARSYETLSMESVARAAGVTKPVVYDFFKNRAELLSELISRERDRSNAQLAAMIPTEVWREIDPDDLLTNIVRSFLEAVQAQPKTWLLALHPVEGTPHEIREQIVEIRDETVQLVSALVKKGLDVRGSDHKIDHEMLARVVVSTAEEAARLLLERPKDYSIERAVTFTDWLIRLIPRTVPYPAVRAEP